jgi:hypothetical protein
MVIMETKKVCDYVAPKIGVAPTSFQQISGEKVGKND